MLSVVTDLHLAATPWSADNLMREGVARADIVVTGNTVIDALLETLRRPDLLAMHAVEGVTLAADEPLVLITLHRRENWLAASTSAGSPLEEVLEAIAATARSHPRVRFVYPVHRNPNVQAPARRILGGLANVHLLDPQPYIPFVGLLSRATVILTDSGGIQEEAPSLGVPVLVARETTERPEGVDAGGNMLVGTDRDRVARTLAEHLDRPRTRPAALPCPNPFGDGGGAARVHDALRHRLGMGGLPEEFRPPARQEAQTSGPRPGGAAAHGGR